MEWISIKDRMPKVGESILITDGKNIKIGQYTVFNKQIRWSAPIYFKAVTHWMSLPNLPKAWKEVTPSPKDTDLTVYNVFLEED